MTWTWDEKLFAVGLCAFYVFQGICSVCSFAAENRRRNQEWREYEWMNGK